MPIEFLTLPDELQGLANELWEELSKRGYRNYAEPDPLELPAAATIRAHRGHETHFFLVRAILEINEIDQWHRYACSCTTDTRVTICCPVSAPTQTALVLNIAGKGIGLATEGVGGFRYDPAARDLAFHAKAPDRSSLKPRVRQLLGEALDRLENGDWRPAFEDACGVLEEQCRAYLLRNVKMGRVKYQAGSKIKVPTAKQIQKMTLGALKDIFCKMQSQNQIEAKLCAALTKLNPDRIRRVHNRGAKAAEAALRRRVGTHFWLINNALSLLV